MQRMGLLVLIAIFLGVQQGYGQRGLPDLTIKAVKISPSSVEAGESAQLRAVVINQGQSDVFALFDVLFELNGRELGVRSLFELKAQQTSELQIPWQAVAGTHKLIVYVDSPFNNVRESNESNNKFSLQFTIAPPAGVRSFSLDLINVFGRALEGAGGALKFEMTDSVFSSLDNAVRALQDTAAALREASTELQLLQRALSPVFINHSQCSEAGALVLLFDTFAELFLRIGGTLSIGNFDGVLENAHALRRKLVQLAGQQLADTSFAPLQLAIEQFDKVIALAAELNDLLKGAQGRPQYQVAVELFNAFIAFGDQLRLSAQEIMRQAKERSARFYDVGGQLLNSSSSYVSGTLTIELPGALVLLRLELYDLSGTLVHQSEADSSLLQWEGTAAGTYFYKLTGLRKNGSERVELGRLRVQ